MSNLIEENRVDERCIVKPCCGVDLIIEHRKKDLGEFSVRRVLPVRSRTMVGPWLFFDHLGPTRFKPGNGINIRPHPHINIATVTYLFEGEILHRDSLGNSLFINAGAINLMVAGSGIVHSEREREEVHNTDHTLHALQLWLALPADKEEIDAAFFHYPAEQIPQTTIDGVPVRVLMGSAFGLTSPVKTFAQTLYVEASLKSGQTIRVAEVQQRAVYVLSGRLEVSGRSIHQHTMAVLAENARVDLIALEDSKIVIIGGEKMTDRYLEWNFASSKKSRIEQAKRDWREGRFPLVPGDEEEFIPLPD